MSLDSERGCYYSTRGLTEVTPARAVKHSADSQPNSPGMSMSASSLYTTLCFENHSIEVPAKQYSVSRGTRRHVRSTGL